ncbi:NAD(P)/FAD-dependent oxidoreductase [Allostreptomyces psammosilenae]|uniref:D-amino-acid dehydrogenase n=1 Tax=Allostreptomyces psammosilenae TaxID=1892865 RepID=A0A853A0U0_9ACTN|nr:FAD-dependent oxidoreductase [Allostreptomyces psammosilenae]NYI04018.1 D-amino-acid dehydrogenase [Allostreptomyces psammosilenae]
MRIVVVGAGVAGSSIAYHLARKGAEVELVDRADAGQATAAGAGMLAPWLAPDPDPDEYRLASAGAVYHQRLAQLLAEDGEGDVGYARVGALAVHRDPDVLRRTRDLVRERAAEDPTLGRVGLLDPRETSACFPALDPRLGAVHVESGARVDGRKLRDAMQRAAVRHGARMRTGSAELRMSGSRVQGVDVHCEAVNADAVVVAGGAWSQTLIEPIAPRLPVHPERGQIVDLHLIGHDTSTWPVVHAIGSSHYLLAFPGARVVAGATREMRAGFDHRLTAGGVAEVLGRALELAPGLADASLLDTRIGFRPHSPDGKPMLGAFSAVPGLFAATGFGASGLTVAPLAGRLVAELVLEGKPDTGETGVDLAAFDPLRPSLRG